LVAVGVGGCTRPNDGSGLPGWGPGGVGSGGNDAPDLAGNQSTGPDVAGHGNPDLATPWNPNPDLASPWNPPNPDLASPDLSTPWSPPDLAQPGGCGNGKVNCGAKAKLAVGGSIHFTDNSNYDFWVTRDSGGVLAVSAVCPHQGCDVNRQGSGWYCPCHGATFALDGTAPTGPASSPLPCFAVCVDGNGILWVDYTTQVAPSTRA
jgi:nitrite reductase/ring-hydroxylating ferredoxin subunit